MDSLHSHETNSKLIGSYPLLAGEKVISITPHPVLYYPEKPSSVKQLLRLTRSNHIDEIGNAGPALAAMAMPLENGMTRENSEYLHLYEALFGRDSLRMAHDMVEIYPELARATIMSHAELQGVTFNIPREEEEGRIFHEARDPDDPIAKKHTVEYGWQWPYYGTVDATPEFIRTLTSYTLSNTGNHNFLEEKYIDRNGKERTINDALDGALNWIARRREQNPEGLIESKSVLPHGIENQVWKDSWDSYHHADGTLANHEQGVASLEVQVAAYDALLDAAELYDRLIDNETHADALRAQAIELKNTIFKHFWIEEKGGYFVLGTDRSDDGTLRQLKIRTSNMGHTLNSRLLECDDPEVVRKREAVVGNILSPELLCYAGIRTLASDEIRFRPGAYHNGSVWLWDTHYIANGLRRHHYDEEANSIDKHLIEVADTTGLFLEYVRGEQNTISVNQRTITLWDQNANRINKVEQPPQQNQGWTVTAIRDSKHQAHKRAG